MLSDMKVRQRKYPSLTSLIDIIFLLLLFFMLSSTFSKYSEVTVTAAQAGAGGASTKPQLFIALSGDAWRVNGKPAEAHNIGELLSSYKSEGETRAIVRVNTETSSQSLIDALEILNLHEIKVTMVR